jgi:hypothetical protein
MHRAIRLSKRAKGAVFTVVPVACGIALWDASCVTAAPPDVPTPPQLGPIIVQDAVQPTANSYLAALPSTFVVPVKVFSPTPTITCHVFVDFDTGGGNGLDTLKSSCADTPPALDGGLTSLRFILRPIDLGDPNACHVIQCLVADSFASNSAHTPGDSLGANSVGWQYAPNGPGTCDEFDASDGAFPPDGPTDTGLLIPPAEGGPPL